MSAWLPPCESRARPAPPGRAAAAAGRGGAARDRHGGSRVATGLHDRTKEWCWGIKDWNGNDGAQLQLWDCAGTLSQKWRRG